ncbi:MAG TPA: right-handed parallel beta-helix repeat-containing protein [Allosphingosinicella sp.]|jgi:hypothetical protein
MDRREFLATTGAAAALAAPAAASAQIRPPGFDAGRAGLDITDFGIVAGDDDALAISNSAAVEKLLAHLLANNPTPGLPGTAAVKVTAPAGHFRFARPWVVKAALWLEGQSNSQRYGYATHFDFDTAGFQFHGARTNAKGLENPPTTGAAGFRLENIYCTSRAPTGTGHHGIHAVVRGDVIRCTAYAFPGDGIRIESLTGFGASNNNANGTRILYCQAGGNGGCGIRLMNGDANTCITVGCELHRNGEFGLYDNAFLSNSHTGHHSEGNGLAHAYPEHKTNSVSSACYYPIAQWASGATIAVSTPGTYRASAGKLYRLLKAGGGSTANPPTHTSAALSVPPVGADGYQWAYEGKSLNRLYHVALGETAAASRTVPGTNDAVWVPYQFVELSAPRADIPLWKTGMTWKEGGSYGGSSQAGESVWTACYQEGDGQPFAQIRSPAIWVGGQSGLSPWSSCVRVKAEPGTGSLSNAGGFFSSRPYHDGSPFRALFGSGRYENSFLQVWHDTLHPKPLTATLDRDSHFRLDEYPSDYLTMTGHLTAFTGGRSTPQPGVLNIPHLFVGSGANARNVDYGPAAPGSGFHAAGEVVFNTAPAAGGKIGWVCTAAGTPGTWKGFGAIDP